MCRRAFFNDYDRAPHFLILLLKIYFSSAILSASYYLSRKMTPHVLSTFFIKFFFPFECLFNAWRVSFIVFVEKSYCSCLVVTNIFAFVPEFVFGKEIIDNFYACSFVSFSVKFIRPKSSARNAVELLVFELFVREFVFISHNINLQFVFYHLYVQNPFSLQILAKKFSAVNRSGKIRYFG